MEDEKRLYMYVYRMIRTDIYNGKYMHGDKLPSLNELCEQYEVGRNTVRSALMKLQEKDYIVMQKGTQATVVFDIHDFHSHQEYVQELVNSRQMSLDVFETIEAVFPDVAYICISRLNSQQIQELSQRIKNISVATITNAQELIQQIYDIYLYAFSILKNPVLEDLFMSMMNSVYFPILEDDHVETELKRNIKMIKTSLGMLIKFSKIHNKFMIKNIVAAMCKGEAKIVEEYIKELGGDVEATRNNQFIWIGNRSQDYLYVRVISGILTDIYNHVYKKDEILPSISKLSGMYNVSEKTSRKALEVLRTYQVIETINGVGSKVILNDFEDKGKLLVIPELKNNIQEYFYSLEIIMIMAHSLFKKLINDLTNDELTFIQKELEKKSILNLEPMYDFLFEKTNLCLKSIYYELKKFMAFRVIVDSMIDYSTYDFENLRTQMFEAFEKKNRNLIYEISDKVSDLSIRSLKTLIENVK